MLTGSYRAYDALEVWDLRTGNKSKVIAWEGTGAVEEEGQTPTMSEAGEESDNLSFSRQSTNNAIGGSQTTAMTPTGSQKSKPIPPRGNTSYPFIYTAHFSKKEDLVVAGGAGKNEMRVFDWKTGNIVCLVNSLPKSVLCSDMSSSDNMLAFGASDSRVRVFNVTKEQ